MSLSDTHPKAEKVLIELARKATPAEKLAMMRSWSRVISKLAWRGIRRANPELSDREIDLLFVEHCYDKDLADRLRKYLAKRDD